MARHQVSIGCRVRERQRGAALFIALIALVFMLLGGLALVRSVDTANLIAGNFAFRQATLQASDAGVEAAFARLGALAGAFEADAAGYSALWDGKDEPGDADWARAMTGTTPGGVSYAFIIQRLCTSVPGSDPRDECISGDPDPKVKSGGVDDSPFPVPTSVYYRATIRVQGPRNTARTVQALFSH